MERGRVIVGVDDSLTGLRTLRAAVAEARCRHRELFAVRAFPFPPDRDSERRAQLAYGLSGLAGMPLGPSPSWRQELVAREQQALSVVGHAFSQAMGGVPDQVRVRALAMPGAPGPVLVGTASGENDLLVVGTSLSARRRRPFRRSVSRYCAARAACPVLLVPPHEFAREAGKHRPWHRRELENLLAADGLSR
jgi:nucleotide-binding universal stress UspA family protein